MQLNSEIFFIHIMKTAGTSLRRMFTANFDESMTYPNDADLRKTKDGFYPSLSTIIRRKQAGELRNFKILCGHYPFFLGKLVFNQPRYIVFLRDPIARTISMIEHRKMKTPEFQKLSYEEILDHKTFVKNQLENYQTKVFAFRGVEQCDHDTNIPLEITPENYQLALKRLDEVDVVGLTEFFDESVELIEEKFRFNFNNVLHANRGAYDVQVSEKVRQKIMDINQYDMALYDHAKAQFLKSMNNVIGFKGS
ncbi:MAG: sulfotransferase family 2 domain-containing protein [Xanthomonadales bacterium]|nr:sulfotransferase family 2 domain-containing protein [Xanthomonadales bacterium]